MSRDQNTRTVDPADWAVVALGSNLGDSVTAIRRTMEKLREFALSNFHSSSLWESEPVDCPPGSPPFINAVVGFIPRDQEPLQLLSRLQELERSAGRRPKQVLNEARPLDLDLITFGRQTSHDPSLTLPHPRAHLRSFVLSPLVEIAPGLILPGQTVTVKECLAQLGTQAGLARRLS